MTYQEIQDKIVSTFWSEGLKAEIARRNYVFPAEKLLCLAYKQAKNDNQAMEWMKLFAREVLQAADHALLVIQWMENCLAKFRTADENKIFEVRIDSDGTDDSIRYFCTTYDGCLDAIDQHYVEHAWDRETENACYTIIKHRILRPGDPIGRYQEQFAELGPGKVIAHIPTEMTCEYGECEGDCSDCPHPCVDCTEDLIPEWIPDLSPVRFLRFKEVRYGLVLSGGCDSWEAYIIPLESSMFEEGLEAYRDCLHHEHIRWPNVEPIEPDALPMELRKNYDGFVAFWKALYPNKYGEEPQ